MDVESLRLRSTPLIFDPDADFSDLGELGDLIGDARVVGLGESAHGVREFTEMKSRMIKFLVEECGFRAVALEASYSACTLIDNWVRTGAGDRETALSATHYLAWDCTEFAELLDWLRVYNARVDQDQHVSFYGLDPGFNQVGRDRVSEFLGRHAPDQLGAIETSFAILGQAEDDWPFRIDDAGTAAIISTQEPLERLARYLHDDPDRLAEAVPAPELAEIGRLVRVMRQFADWPEFTRSIRMGENLVDLVENADVIGGFVVWAHNTHLGVGIPGGNRHLGDVVADRLGPAYRSIAFEFGSGTFLTRELDEDGFAGALVPTTMAPPPADSLPDRLSQLDGDAFLIDLEGLNGSESAAHGGMWIAGDPDTLYEPMEPARNFDGLVFVRHITPTRPTENARWAADQRICF